ncbi:hypothetical protein [Rodentibacter trehalosifermentans]|nr:hypothetical protein [Rodentibacter trehalosifermentans]
MSKKQSNEHEIQNLLQELKKLLNEVGWDKKVLAKKVVESQEEYFSDTEEEIEKKKSKEYEIIRKLFNRPPKKEETLHFYISFIVEHEDNKKLDFCKLPELENFDDNQKEILTGIAEISSAFFKREKGE